MTKLLKRLLTVIKESIESMDRRRKVVKFKYPDLRFTIDNNNLTIILCYHFESASFPVKSNVLIVTMNEDSGRKLESIPLESRTLELCLVAMHWNTLEFHL